METARQRPIRILPENVANQIAAGEVVERPASVLKELMENSLDAGARRIVVTVAGAGRRLIRVLDDGLGMSADDLLLALERHATSKVAKSEDLAAIVTLGFRGEALPSIAAVSRLLMRSRPAGAAVGSQLTAAGGAIKAVEEVGCPAGTLVEVRDLFFNTPARRKFLKSPATEAGHLGQAFGRLALARPGVAMRYQVGERTLYDLPAGDDLAPRVAALLGREALASMRPLEQQEGLLVIRGLAALPSYSRLAWDQVFTFVNGRYVRDRVLLHALGQAYQGLLPAARRPVAVLHLELEPSLVDVNVHPGKTEVRFRRQGEVHDALARGLRRALGGRTAAPGRATPPAGARPLPAGGYYPPPRPAASPAKVAQGGQGELSPREPAGPAASLPAADWPGVQGPVPLFEPAGELSYLAQLHGLYLLCSTPQGLVLVDQHAAHERLAFVRLRRAWSQGSLPRQALLNPQVLELSPREAAWAQEQAEDWDRLGLELEHFGGPAWAVRALPPLLAGSDPAPLVRDLLSELAQSGCGVKTPRFAEEALRSLACRAALKKGQRMGAREAQELLAGLAALPPPHTCPHGRPVMLLLSRQRLAAAFGRSGPGRA